MGQVPASRPVSGQSPYGFVGDGRLSRHWRHYFTSLGLPWTLWSRRLARANGVAGRSAADSACGLPHHPARGLGRRHCAGHGDASRRGSRRPDLRAFLRRAYFRGRFWRASAHELCEHAVRACVLSRYPDLRGRGPSGSGRVFPRPLSGPAESLFRAQAGRQGVLPRALRARGRDDRRALARILRRDGSPFRRSAFGARVPIRAASSRTCSNRPTAR